MLSTQKPVQAQQPTYVVEFAAAVHRMACTAAFVCCVVLYRHGELQTFWIWLGITDQLWSGFCLSIWLSPSRFLVQLLHMQQGMVYWTHTLTN